jgi:hypothetical protein
MRQVTSHKVAGNEKNELFIAVTDEPGAGGASHEYVAYYSPDPEGIEYASPIVNINFQNGPIPVNGINGVTHEVLLAIVADRLNSFQIGPYPCAENDMALHHVVQALNWLKQRTEDRIKRAVEGQLKA